MRKNLIILTILFLSLTGLAAEESLINKDDSPVRFFLESELGTVKINYHTLLIGSETEGTGTTFDYVSQGGQELLFRFERYNAGMVINNSHRISFLYQPLEVTTRVTFKEDVIVDSVTFTSGTPMEITYGFPFYRITYGYDFFKQEEVDLGIGGGFTAQERLFDFSRNWRIPNDSQSKSWPRSGFKPLRPIQF